MTITSALKLKSCALLESPHWGPYLLTFTLSANLHHNTSGPVVIADKSKHILISFFNILSVYSSGFASSSAKNFLCTKKMTRKIA